MAKFETLIRLDSLLYKMQAALIETQRPKQSGLSLLSSSPPNPQDPQPTYMKPSILYYLFQSLPSYNLSVSLIHYPSVFRSPYILFPCEFQQKNFLVMLLAGFLYVCPIQCQHRFLTSWFIGNCLVLSITCVSDFVKQFESCYSTQAKLGYTLSKTM